MVWDWKRTAAEARRKLVTAKHGAREAALGAAGGSIDVNTVRRAVVALEFLDRLKATDRESYSVLENSSFGVVETFSRWWSINAADAVVGLSKWKKGELTTRGLAASMRKSASPRVGTTNDEPLLQSYRDYVEPRLRHDIETRLDEKVIRSENKRPAHRPPVDFRYSFTDSFGGRDREVAAIVVGPYQNQSIYRKKRHDWMLKALGLAHFFDWVFVVISSEITAGEYITWLERARAEIGADHMGYGPPRDAISRVMILVVQ
ncbi:hypothetical protein [Bradyrhizobium vignae]|uniref:Uncharacterized protein n=1 Tax=Bradyrhizobium vignae TaxID=1549949 RepID=A0A2U3PUF6_9BRAD|nr:hypothetical protein [Bradyrhizobium vignae]SPP92783.1 protein of unknown function [Bradyrhizobium vignae]